jgi:hypothetical protein
MNLKTVCSVFFAGVLLVSAAAANAAEAKKYMMTEPFNGYAWRSLDRVGDDKAHLMKTCLVRGIYEGSFTLDPENAYEQYGPWVSFGDLVSSLDRFYAEEKNLSIPTTYALVLIARKSQGSSLHVITGPSSDNREKQSALVSMENR